MNNYIFFPAPTILNTLETTVFKNTTKALISQRMKEMRYGFTIPYPQPLAQMYFGIKMFWIFGGCV